MAGKKTKTETVIISFKISKDYYKQLEQHAPHHEDAVGIKLTPSTYARKLVIEGLKLNKNEGK